MQFTLLLITYLLAFSVNGLDLGLALDLDISSSIGALLDGDLNLGTGTSILSIITGTVASVSSDLTVSGTLTMGSSAGSKPILSIAEGITMTVDALVLNGGDITVTGGGFLVILGDATFNAETSVSGNVNVSGAVQFSSGALVSLSGALQVAGDASLEAGAAILIESGNWATFAANTTIAATAEINCDADAELHFQGSIFGFGTIAGNGIFRFGGSADVDAEVETEVDVEAAVSIGSSGASELAGRVRFSGNFLVSAGASVSTRANAFIVFSAQSSLQALEVAADATVEFAAEADAQIESSVTINAGAKIEAKGSLTIQGDISGSGELLFSSSSSSESEVRSSTVSASVTVSGASSLFIARANARTTFSSDLIVSGSARLFVSTGSSLTVSGNAVLGSDIEYGVVVSSSESVDVLTVEGEVELGGTLQLNSDIDLEIGAEATIMFYGSRVEGSAFAEITIGSSKRSLNDSEWVVEYEDDRAVITRGSSSALFLSVLALILLAFQ